LATHHGGYQHDRSDAGRKPKRGDVIMPRNIISTIGMSSEDRYKWRKMAKSGDAYVLPGAFGDQVYLPKTASDVDPAGARRRNELRLESLKRIVDYTKKTKGKNYRKSLFGLKPTG